MACSVAFNLWYCFQQHVKFKEFDVVFYNNLLATPLLIVASFLVESEQWRTGRYSALPPEDLKASNLFLAIVISSISSFAISYCSSWCVRATSSTTFSMAGALNKLPIAVAGMVVFGDPVTPGSVLGVGIGKFRVLKSWRPKNSRYRDHSSLCSWYRLYQGKVLATIAPAERNPPPGRRSSSALTGGHGAR